MELQAVRALVPTFIRENEEHFIPRWHPKSSGTARRRNDVANLSFHSLWSWHVFCWHVGIEESFKSITWGHLKKVQPRSANPLGLAKSMKLDRRFSGITLSVMSKRTDLYWALAITRVRLPVPAKNSSHVMSWPRPAAWMHGLSQWKWKLWDDTPQGMINICGLNWFDMVWYYVFKISIIYTHAPNWNPSIHTPSVLLQSKGPQQQQDNHDILLWDLVLVRLHTTNFTSGWISCKSI